MNTIFNILSSIPSAPIHSLTLVVEGHTGKVYLKVVNSKYEIHSPLSFAPETIELVVYTEIPGWQEILRKIPGFYEKKDVKINGNSRYYVFSYKQAKTQ